jgi:hypothetical protein
MNAATQESDGHYSRQEWIIRHIGELEGESCSRNSEQDASQSRFPEILPHCTLFLCGQTVLMSRLRHKYQQAMLRYGDHGRAIFSMTCGFGSLRFR